MSVIKGIIDKAKSEDYDSDFESELDNTQQPSNQDTKLPSNPVTQQVSNQGKKKKVKKKTLNFEVPVEVGNYWMGKIKGEGGQYKKTVTDFLVKKFGLPEGYTKDDL